MRPNPTRPLALRLLRHLTVALCAGALLAACGGGTGPAYGGDGDGDGDAGGGCTGDVVMSGNAFSPATDTVSAGTTVTWCNENGVDHTVTADDGSFDSGRVSPDGTFQRTFDQPGTVPYHCTIHGAPDAGMHGTLVVE